MGILKVVLHFVCSSHTGTYGVRMEVGTAMPHANVDRGCGCGVTDLLQYQCILVAVVVVSSAV